MRKDAPPACPSAYETKQPVVAVLLKPFPYVGVSSIRGCNRRGTSQESRPSEDEGRGTLSSTSKARPPVHGKWSFLTLRYRWKLNDSPNAGKDGISAGLFVILVVRFLNVSNDRIKIRRSDKNCVTLRA